MNTKTKKIVIVSVAVVAVVAVVTVLYFKLHGSSNTVDGIINRLDASNDIKKAIKSNLAKAKLNQDINANAAANGISYDQALVLSAAYYLVSDGIVDLNTWYQWKDQVQAM